MLLLLSVSFYQVHLVVRIGPRSHFPLPTPNLFIDSFQLFCHYLQPKQIVTIFSHVCMTELSLFLSRWNPRENPASETRKKWCTIWALNLFLFGCFVVRAFSIHSQWKWGIVTANDLYTHTHNYNWLILPVHKFSLHFFFHLNFSL